MPSTRHLVPLIGLFFLGVVVRYTQYDNSSTFSNVFKKITELNYKPTRKVEMIPGSKWIVITSIQLPTEDVKKLAIQTGYNLVLVADKKTPSNWSYPGVHFLSIDRQLNLFGGFARRLPYNSYTRKNLGYLYALSNGAEWIYDTDDDNKPFGRGLTLFDYSDAISGLCYAPQSGNFSTKLFNPYQFYGFRQMWPRGFPLEYLNGHSNGKNRMISCKSLPRPAVQQGIVKTDPDVDAIYRLLHADKNKGLNVTFNSIVPPILLNAGTYSPWNSQNTLFHYKAFFTMFLPTTVDFRVTDIWRSFFAQKLLHIIGEYVAFYPMNAVQVRNAHNYLNDFNQEIDVYEQAGKILEFLDGWDCPLNDTASCVVELAEEFVNRNFFGMEDKNLIAAWIEQLKQLGYQFPELTSSSVLQATGITLDNCRQANLDLGTETNDENKELKWAVDAVSGFGELLNWCKTADGNIQVIVPTAKAFLQRYLTNTPLNAKSSTVLVIVSNYPWTDLSAASIPILQRLYGPFFKTVIFCGTWTEPLNLELRAQEPINFINITVDEMRNGHRYGYCLPKIRDLRLQNVTGYYFVADDTMFNIWYNLTLNSIVTSYDVHDHPGYWKAENIKRALDLVENKYKSDTKLQISWKRYMELKYYNNTPRDQFLTVSRKIIADFYYLPANLTDFVADLMEILVEAEVFVEVAFGKIFDVLPLNNKHDVFKYLWYDGSRERVFLIYNDTELGLHPLKMSGLHTFLPGRAAFCSTVIKSFGKHIYY